MRFLIRAKFIFGHGFSKLCVYFHQLSTLLFLPNTKFYIPYCHHCPWTISHAYLPIHIAFLFFFVSILRPSSFLPSTCPKTPQTNSPFRPINIHIVPILPSLYSSPITISCSPLHLITMGGGGRGTWNRGQWLWVDITIQTPAHPTTTPHPLPLLLTALLHRPGDTLHHTSLHPSPFLPLISRPSSLHIHA